MFDAGFYTVIEECGGEEREHRIFFEPHVGGGATIVLPGDGPTLSIDHQQLGELAILFFAMAKMDDLDSVPELLEGYGANKDDMLFLKDQLLQLAAISLTPYLV